MALRVWPAPAILKSEPIARRVRGAGAGRFTPLAQSCTISPMASPNSARLERASSDPPTSAVQSLLGAHRMWLDGAWREAGVLFCSIAPTTASEARFAIGGAMQAAASLLRAGILPPPRVSVHCNVRPAVSA